VGASISEASLPLLPPEMEVAWVVTLLLVMLEGVVYPESRPPPPDVILVVMAAAPVQLPVSLWWRLCWCKELSSPSMLPMSPLLEHFFKAAVALLFSARVFP